MNAIAHQRCASLDIEVLVQQFYQPLYQFAMRLSGNADAAADITQNTFLTVLQKGDQLRDMSKIKSWLYTVLYRVFLSERRRESRFPCQTFDEMADSCSETARVPGEKIDAKAVVNILAGLPQMYQAPLTLFYFDQMSYREIAELLNIPVGTVMSRLSRGKALLRAGLDVPLDANDGHRPIKNAVNEPAGAPPNV